MKSLYKILLCTIALLTAAALMLGVAAEEPAENVPNTDTVVEGGGEPDEGTDVIEPDNEQNQGNTEGGNTEGGDDPEGSDNPEGGDDPENGDDPEGSDDPESQPPAEEEDEEEDEAPYKTIPSDPTYSEGDLGEGGWSQEGYDVAIQGNVSSKNEPKAIADVAGFLSRMMIVTGIIALFSIAGLVWVNLKYSPKRRKKSGGSRGKTNASRRPRY